MRTDLYTKAVLTVSAIMFTVIGGKTLILETAVSAQGQKPNPVDSEAQTIARGYWDKVLAKCGDSYYAARWSAEPLEATEFREVSFGIVPNAISRADQLNGIQWDGNAVLVARLYRTQQLPSRGMTLKELREEKQPFPWGPWKDGEYARPTLKVVSEGGGNGSDFVHITKKLGHWSLRYDPDEIARQKPACSFLSSIPGDTPAK